MARISQYSLNRKRTGKLGGPQFLPDLKEWSKACKVYAYDTQIYRHFDICAETFYVFLDRERYKEEQGEKSEYLEAYKKGRNETKQFVLSKLLEGVHNNDMAATIFAAKTFGGVVESKDLKTLALKKKEFLLKQKEFLSRLAERYELDFNELKRFADKFFKDVKIDDL